MRNMNKKKLMTFAVLGLFAFTLVSGALVSYLSGVVTGNVSIDSPVVLSAADDDSVLSVTWTASNQLPADADFTEGVGSLDLTGIFYGGEGEGFWIKVENLASVEAEGDLVFEIYCDEGITMNCADIGDFDATMNVYDWIDGAQVITGPQDVESLMSGGLLQHQVIDSKTLRIWDVNSYLYEAGANGDEYYVFVDMDFELNAHGNYNIKVAFMDNPLGTFPTA